MPHTARYWIDRLGLHPHPEGGYYRETYQSELTIPQAGLPPDFPGPRLVSTAIYFFLDGETFSAFHRLRSDEMWHFYAGSTLTVHVIDADGQYSQIHMGPDIEHGENFQAVVKAGCWFASAVRDSASYALVGCTVAPGFDFADFKLARREELASRYPEHRKVIERFTRQ